MLSWLGIGGNSIRVPKADTYDVETNSDKRARTLKHLIKANHINHSVIYNDLRFHNHTPHILCSAFIWGADADELNHVYDVESHNLEPWVESPSEIARHDWREYLGKREYQRAYLDFFEDELVRHNYDWRALLNEYLLEGKEPLINNMVSGLGHPLIHLGYANEMTNAQIAVEALVLGACFRNDWHVFLDDPKYTQPAPNPTDSLFTILDRVSHDPTFEGLGDFPGSDNIEPLLANEKMAAKALEYWNSWQLKSPTEQFSESQKLAVALIVAAQTPKDEDRYDFFAVHLLTTSHAVRVLLPLIPAKHHIPLIRQWWLFTLLVYIAQLRPKINIDVIKLVELEGRDWSYVTDKAIKGKWRTDAHYVKALRSMWEASKTWGDGNQFYLKAAVKMAEDFDGWGGFGPRELDMEQHENSSGREEEKKETAEAKVETKPPITKRFSGLGIGGRFW